MKICPYPSHVNNSFGQRRLYMCQKAIEKQDFCSLETESNVQMNRIDGHVACHTPLIRTQNTIIRMKSDPPALSLFRPWLWLLCARRYGLSRPNISQKSWSPLCRPHMHPMAGKQHRTKTVICTYGVRFCPNSLRLIYLNDSTHKPQIISLRYKYGPQQK